MQQVQVHLPEIKLVGISARTSNASELNPMKAKILITLQRYFNQQVANLIPCRKNVGVTYCAYTHYESNYNGEYTYFVGEEVTSFNDIPDSLDKLMIPGQAYTKFTNGPGIMPAVCLSVWQKIWQTPSILGGERSYITDFEIYDKRALNPANTTLDIYVGIHVNA